MTHAPRYSHSDGRADPVLKARFDAVCAAHSCIGDGAHALLNVRALPAPSGVMKSDHMQDWLPSRLHEEDENAPWTGGYVGGPLVVAADDTEAMVDRVVKGVLDGSVSRSQVRQIKGAITGREASDTGSDALGRAIGAKKP